MICVNIGWWFVLDQGNYEAFGGRAVDWSTACDAAWVQCFLLSRDTCGTENPSEFLETFYIFGFEPPPSPPAAHTWKTHLQEWLLCSLNEKKLSKPNKLLLPTTPLSQLPSVAQGPWMKSLSMERSTQSMTRFPGSDEGKSYFSLFLTVVLLWCWVTIVH